MATCHSILLPATIALREAKLLLLLKRGCWLTLLEVPVATRGWLSMLLWHWLLLHMLLLAMHLHLRLGWLLV
jgi:ABC-type sugar transport system permease subunit